MATRTSQPSALDRVIRWSIEQRLLVVIVTLGILGFGAWKTSRMNIDVFPDLTAPMVTIVTDAHGLAPQETEAQVTMPIEAAVNGATGVRRVRSSSGTGTSLVWVEFDWGTDIYRARQIVSEKLQSVALDGDIGEPTLAPISSIMGEISFIGVTSKTRSPMELREIARWQLQRRLQALAGVARVTVIGGELKQFQIEVEPQRLLQHGVSIADVVAALSQANKNTTGGFLISGAQESVVRGLGRLQDVQDIEQVVVATRDDVPLTIGRIANVKIGAAFKRGEGSVNSAPAAVIGIQKQPGQNTIELTGRVDRELLAISEELPKDVHLESGLLRQADFIETSVNNVKVALRDGAILVALILFFFLWNWRTTLISLAAMPASLAMAIIVMDWLELSINTMTLGGFTIAIGAIVDDAIIDVENVYRRLRERRQSGDSRDDTNDTNETIYRASSEIRHAIVFATLIVGLVYLPLFFLSGVEGRLLVPLGLAYLIALISSLFVALTLTPALCSFMLGGRAPLADEEGFVVRFLKRLYARPLAFVLRYPRAVVGVSVLLVVTAATLVPFLGRSFLPEFNEGALTISAVTAPGTSLATSDRLGRQLERALLQVPEVASTARRTGRSELDEHAQEIYASEIDVRLAMKSRDKEAMLRDVRAKLAKVDGIRTTIGQPISHRIDHMLSGTRAAIAIKIFGDDLDALRSTAERIESAIKDVQGAVDVAMEQPANVPQMVVRFDDRVRRYGATRGGMAEALERSLVGSVATQILDGQRYYDAIVRYRDATKTSQTQLENTLINTPSGTMVPVKMIATVYPDQGPSTISRENAKRKLVVMANVSGRDLGSVVDDIQRTIKERVTLPKGVYVSFGGQFNSAQEARTRLTMLGVIVVVGIFVLLIVALGSTRLAILTMTNLPLAFIGGVLSVFAASGIVSIGSLIGFVTLFGIATRNGLIMVTHFEHLLAQGDLDLIDTVQQGSMDKLSPILMTALSAALALVPLVLAGNEPGNEIQAPMGVVILGGLLTSTLLNLFVVPALYAQYGRAAKAH